MTILRKAVMAAAAAVMSVSAVTVGFAPTTSAPVVRADELHALAVTNNLGIPITGFWLMPKGGDTWTKQNGAVINPGETVVLANDGYTADQCFFEVSIETTVRADRNSGDSSAYWPGGATGYNICEIHTATFYIREGDPMDPATRYFVSLDDR